MKRIFSASVCIVAALSLCSCLRDAHPLPSATSRVDSSPSESVTASTTLPHESESASESVTESKTEPTELPLRAEVVKWCSANPISEEVLMTYDEIKAENERMLRDSESMCDIFSFGESITRETLSQMIARHDIPHGRFDSDGNEIHAEHIDRVRRRMTLEDATEYSVSYAVMTSRGYVRAIPDSKPYRTSPKNPYDTVQSTELAVGTPVLVLYTSYDNEYYFILSQCYSGWIRCDEAATADSREAWLDFARPQSFICIAEPLYRDGEIKLDMGATLPLVGADGSSYSALLPSRRADGSAEYISISVPCSAASEGYLPYTYKNYLVQAFKYEGTPYGWGGLDDGVDCSGFVCNVFRCFGFVFPRDTSQQNSVIGDSCMVDATSAAQLLDTYVPTVVYYPGHTLLYIGRDGADGRYYFIHAPQIGEHVTVTAKDSLSGMTYVCRVAGASIA